MDNKLQICTIKNITWLSAWINQFCPGTTLCQAGIKKRSGIAAGSLLQVLLVLPFTDLRVWQLQRASDGLPHRSTFYDFLGQTTYNWRRLVLMVSLRLIAELKPLTSARQDRVLIIDDSPYKRDRSKKVEYLGRQYDHSSHTYYRGYRMFTLAWSDGHSLVPVGFELLTSSDADKRLGDTPDVDLRTHLGQRCLAATSKATDQTLTMVDRALKAGVPADYLVFDSWFAHPGLLHKLSGRLPVVCMLKNSGKISFRHGKRIYQLKGLYEKVAARKRGKKSNEHQILGSILVDMLSGPTVRVVFLRDRRNPERWLALASTDTSLTPERICRIYAKRWAIEVFFKQAKQQLGLAREFQVRSYAAQIAHTSIVFMRYMMLEYYRRQCTDERTIPGLFYAYVRELQMLAVHVCIQLILLEVLQLIARQGQGSLLEQVIELIGRFYQTHPWLYAFPNEQERFIMNSES
jgi:hypothetical protein